MGNFSGCALKVQPETKPQYVYTWPSKKSVLTSGAMSIKDNSDTEDNDEIVDVADEETESPILSDQVTQMDECYNLVNDLLIKNDSNQSNETNTLSSNTSIDICDSNQTLRDSTPNIHCLNPVVIDFGSKTVKVGFSGDEFPTSMFPAVIGRPKQRRCMMSNEKNVYIGKEAISKRGILSLQYPIQRGIISDFDDIELIYEHIFENVLRVDPEERSVLITDSSFNPKVNKETMAQILFESFSVTAMYIADESVLSLYASGRVTGIVLDSGDGFTSAVPIYEGYALHHASKRLTVAGQDVTEYLIVLLGEDGYKFTTSAEKEIARNIKETLCYVSANYDSKLFTNDNGKQYQMPDGQVITIGSQTFRSTEVMFDTSLIGREYNGVHKLLHSAICACDIDLRRELYQSIVLSGGNTLFPGFEQRLLNEMEKLSSCPVDVQIEADSNRQYSTWIGGSIYSSLPHFKECWLTKDEYFEDGPSVIHRKCF